MVGNTELADYYRAAQEKSDKLEKKLHVAVVEMSRIITEDDLVSNIESIKKIQDIDPSLRTKEQMEELQEVFLAMQKRSKESDKKERDVSEGLFEYYKSISELMARIEIANQYCDIKSGINFGTIEKINKKLNIFTHSQIDQLYQINNNAKTLAENEIKEIPRKECADQKRISALVTNKINRSLEATSPTLESPREK